MRISITARIEGYGDHTYEAELANELSDEASKALVLLALDKAFQRIGEKAADDLPDTEPKAWPEAVEHASGPLRLEDLIRAVDEHRARSGKPAAGGFCRRCETANVVLTTFDGELVCHICRWKMEREGR